MRSTDGKQPLPAALSRRQFCGMLAGGLALSMVGRAQAPKPRPNILLIVTDDQGAHAGCYGDPFARTPNMDRLAREGVRFKNAYVTQASCSPSRSSILTGLYPHENGQYGLSHYGVKMHDDVQTLPALLKNAGYRTGILGKLHVGPEESFPFDYVEMRSAITTRDVRKTAESAGKFIGARPGDPFFLMVNFFDPHRPLDDDAHQVKGIPEDPLTPEEVKPFPWLGVDSPELRNEIAAYYNCVARADKGIGLLLELLEEQGIEENTLVIFVGDHGAPFTRGKTTCYEGGVHVPLIMRGHGVRGSGAAPEALVSTIDLVPTILDAAGVAKPPRARGMSLLPFGRNDETKERKYLFTEYISHALGHYFPRRAVRDARYKLILNLLQDRDNPVLGLGAWAPAQKPDVPQQIKEVYARYKNPPPVELFDLQEDPNEFHNLADDPAHDEKKQELLAALEAWRRETNDPWLDPEFFADFTRRNDYVVAHDLRWDDEVPKE